MIETYILIIFIVVLLVMGVTLSILGIVGIFKARTIVKEWRRAEGVIVGPITDFRHDTEEPEYPIIEFRDNTGRLYTFKSDWTMSGLPGPGSKVHVLYDPRNPKDAIHHTIYSTFFVPLLSVLAGVAAIRVAVYYLF